jgi:hypothetical protein
MADLSRYEQRGKDWFCKKDGSQILAAIRYYPVWDGPFPCSGFGEVTSENVPFYPTCEGNPIDEREVKGDSGSDEQVQGR